MAAKVVPVDLADRLSFGSVVVAIEDKDAQLYHIFQHATTLRYQRFQVLADLSELGHDIAPPNDAALLVEGYLAGQKKKTSALDLKPMRVP